MLLDLIGGAALASGLGYCVVLGAREAFVRTRGAVRSHIRGVVETSAPNTMVTRLLSSMGEHPDEWKLETHTVRHTPTGIQVWRSNGKDYVCIYSYGGNETFPPVDHRKLLTRSERAALWQAMNRLCHHHNKQVESYHRRRVGELLDKHEAARAGVAA